MELRKKTLVLVIVVAMIAGGIGGFITGGMARNSKSMSMSERWQGTDGVVQATLKDGVLTFSGDGAIDASFIWVGLDTIERHQVRHIVIEEGITSIGDYEFSGTTPCYPNLERVTINADLSEIGELAFWNNSNLREVVMNGSCTKIAKNAFDSCPMLTRIP